MAAHSESHHHILPLRLYFTVFAALLVLTAVTVYIASFDFGSYNLVVAMAVAAVKASLVALIFMHLKYDNKMYAIAFVISLVMLAVFVTLTLFDTLGRGEIDAQRDGPITPDAVIYWQSDVSGAGDTISGAPDSVAVAGETAGH